MKLSPERVKEIRKERQSMDCQTVDDLLGHIAALESEIEGADDKLIAWLNSETLDDDMAMINARDHGEWNRYHSLEGHRTALIHVIHHVMAERQRNPQKDSQ